MQHIPLTWSLGNKNFASSFFLLTFIYIYFALSASPSLLLLLLGWLGSSSDCLGQQSSYRIYAKRCASFSSLFSSKKPSVSPLLRYECGGNSVSSPQNALLRKGLHNKAHCSGNSVFFFSTKLRCNIFLLFHPLTKNNLWTFLLSNTLSVFGKSGAVNKIGKDLPCVYTHTTHPNVSLSDLVPLKGRRRRRRKTPFWPCFPLQKKEGISDTLQILCCHVLRSSPPKKLCRRRKKSFDLGYCPGRKCLLLPPPFSPAKFSQAVGICLA